MAEPLPPYHYFKFRAALEALAGSEGTLRRRVMAAMLSTTGLLAAEMPDHVREQWLELQTMITWHKDGDPENGTWQNTLDAMSDEDARKVARQIVLVFEAAVRGSAPFGAD